MTFTRAAARIAAGAEFGDRPISVIREGGPIYRTPDGIVMLAPGRYTYSNLFHIERTSGSPWFVVTAVLEPLPNSDAFPTWLETMRAFVKVTRQASESSVYADPPVTLYTDYEFEVMAPVPWPTTIPGLPTWLPAGVDIVKDYWGRAERPPRWAWPDWPKLPELPDVPQLTGLLWAAAALGGVLLLASRAKRAA